MSTGGLNCHLAGSHDIKIPRKSRFNFVYFRKILVYALCKRQCILTYFTKNSAKSVTCSASFFQRSLKIILHIAFSSKKADIDGV